MAREVWKFIVPFVGGPRMPVPEGAKVLHGGADPATGEPALWMEIDPSAPIEYRQFVAIGTGRAIPLGGTHVGTAVCGPFVWHIYEAGPIAAAGKAA